MDVDNGKIVLTHGDYYFRIYDILDENYFQEITTNVKVKQILIDNNSILYANSWEDKANKVCLYNIESRETKEIISLGNAQLRSNKNDHIFYICDYKDSKYPISFVNAETGKIYHKALFYYKGYDFYYDGKFLHMADKTYDSVNGSLNTSYNTNGENLNSGEYEEYYQLVDSDKYGIIRDNKTSIYVYDNNKDTTIYEFKSELSNAVKIGETRFLLYNYSTSSAIVIDASLIK